MSLESSIILLMKPHWSGVPTIEAARQHVTAVLAEVWDALVLDPVAHAGIGVIPGDAQIDHAQ